MGIHAEGHQSVLQTLLVGALLIRRRTGRTFTELVQERRLNQAAWMLANTRQRVSDIALSVGYENISYFHRIFARRFGCSPKDYRDCHK
jgi:AraC-like DNA-binding protein